MSQFTKDLRTKPIQKQLRIIRAMRSEQDGKLLTQAQMAKAIGISVSSYQLAATYGIVRGTVELTIRKFINEFINEIEGK